MNPDVCATLSAVFPLVLLAVVAQRTTLHPRLRRHRLYRSSIRLAIVSSLAGLPAVVIGQQVGGFAGPASVPVWMLFSLDVVCLGFSILAASATFEIEEERDAPPDP
ncbi:MULTISPECIES: hypothetical protein [Actinomycetes]|uniref:hypothetical protein n=1 Tax=Mycolicibacterium psychrotolerans TaxID=216929 RepID=UPI0027A551F0|nr:hypothetical protein [Amnibacterium kyonggiense]